MGERAFTEPSPSDWERWIERLARGEEPATAAREEGQTCTSFRRQNAGAHADALALSREARAHEADRRGELWALEDGASDAMRIAWLKRWQPAYAGTQKVELTGADGEPVQVEHIGRLTLADVAEQFTRYRSQPSTSD